MLDEVCPHLYNEAVNDKHNQSWQTKETPKNERYGHGSKRSCILSLKDSASNELKTCRK